MSDITDNVNRILAELPAGVSLVAAGKTRSPEEIREAVTAGVSIIGENYVQEAETARQAAADARWHLIGHLQRNKVARAVRVFDLIETVDSAAIAAAISTACLPIDKVMPVLVEVNCGREAGKSGVPPEAVVGLIEEISSMPGIAVSGLMTMGLADVALVRPGFTETRRLYDEITGLNLPGVRMEHLSMGMSASYRIAIEEGANLVRLGTAIFGERPTRA
jgi:pyridoxal phosphate enzyme (YggS family)